MMGSSGNHFGDDMQITALDRRSAILRTPIHKYGNMYAEN